MRQAVRSRSAVAPHRASIRDGSGSGMGEWSEPYSLTSHWDNRQSRHMRIPLWIAATLTLARSLATQIPPPAPPAAAMTARDSALHALNRLAYGPRPAEVDSVARFGVMRWIERQLDPDRIDDKPLERREHAFKILDYDRGDLAQRYRDAQRERQRMQRELGRAGDSMRPDKIEGPMREIRELGGQLQQLAVVRATLSERQLQEVMVDFWTNHFNVFVGKGADRFLLPSYIEQVIRPRVPGRFEDLLIATAESPAMLFYLDNAQSVAPGSSPPRPFRPFSPFFGRRRFGMNEMPEDRRRPQPTGINENYPRELLTLHTLRLDGGDTHANGIQIAPLFTRWSILSPEHGAGVRFPDRAHHSC